MPFRRDLDASIAAFKRAIALNHVDWRFGYVLVLAGQSRRAIDVLDAYVRLDPLYAPFASGFLGFAHYMLKQYAQALVLLRDCASRSPKLRSGHLWLAATYARLGHLKEAQAAVAEVLRLVPNFTIGGTARSITAFKNPEDEQHFFDGLRKAGLPE